MVDESNCTRLNRDACGSRLGNTTWSSMRVEEPLPLGGIVVPVNKLGLVAPWLGLAALAGVAALGVVLVRRRRG